MVRALLLGYFPFCTYEVNSCITIIVFICFNYILPEDILSRGVLILGTCCELCFAWSGLI